MLTRKPILIVTIFLMLITIVSCVPSIKTKRFKDGISIKNDWLYLNGKKFFINAVGYAPWRPGQMPGTDKVDIYLVENDFKRIKEAGFNSIRTWDALNQKELALAKDYGLKVIQGIWIDPNHDFSDPYFQKDSLYYISNVVEWSKNYDNILMYLVITEPKQRTVLYSGIDETLEFFKKIKDTVQSIDNKPVSMDSWIPIGFLNHTPWDIVAFNAFMFTPEAINKTIGFRAYIRWIKENHAKNKPLFIGETGGFSVSSEKLNNIGFGGNSENEQAVGDIESIKECIAGGATGVCTVAWVDTWHYPEDPATHNDHPWEWDGLIGFKDDKDLIGTPRKAYYELKRFNNNGLADCLDKLDTKEKIISKYKLYISPVSSQYKIGDEIEVKIEVKDSKNKPLPDKRVNVGFFLPVGWMEEIRHAMSDNYGQVNIKCGLIPENVDQYLIFSAGISDNENQQETGNIAFIKLDSTK